MARLIDADELEKVMTEDWFLEILAAQDSKSSIKKDIVNMIDSVPLAYDVDAVVEKLGEMKMRYFLTLANTGDEKLERAYDEVSNAINKAIQIVKDGGSDA